MVCPLKLEGRMDSVKQLISDLETDLTQRFKERKREQITFHTLERALDLIKLTFKIARKTGLNEKDTLNLTAAAAFLYTGHWQSDKETLFTSAENAKQFAEEKSDLDEVVIGKLIHSIDSEKEGKPLNEQVLADAFRAYYGQKKLVRNLKLLSLEMDNGPSLLDTLRKAAKDISSFKYNTEYAIQKFGGRKAKNSQKLHESIQKREAKRKKSKKKSRKLGRGIETMYRSIYRTHINLSSIADQKANLIIRVNTIILSIIITLGGTGYTFFETGFFKYSRFTIPVMLFVMGSLLAVIFAVLSARPKVTNKDVSMKRLLGNESSILFFGNFISLGKKEFLRGMGLFRKNDERVYDSMSTDIYYLGHVLDKKYRLVKISYNVFMLGLALSVVSFMGIFMYSQFTQ